MLACVLLIDLAGLPGSHKPCIQAIIVVRENEHFGRDTLESNQKPCTQAIEVVRENEHFKGDTLESTQRRHQKAVQFGDGECLCTG